MIAWRAGMFGLALGLAACTFDFSPYEALYACERDDDCAPGWMCVTAGAGAVCAIPVDAASTDASREGDVQADTSSDIVEDTLQPGDRYLVTSDVIYTEEGEGVLVRVDGTTERRYFIGPEPLALDDARRFCEFLMVGGHPWKLARATELGGLSQCCLTRPGGVRCSGTSTCYDPDQCLPHPRCLGCGAPPEDWACWWHPTFDRPCGVYWAAIDGTCASAFDFRNSERVTLDGSALAGVMCTTSSK